MILARYIGTLTTSLCLNELTILPIIITAFCAGIAYNECFWKCVTCMVAGAIVIFVKEYVFTESLELIQKIYDLGEKVNDERFEEKRQQRAGRDERNGKTMEIQYNGIPNTIATTILKSEIKHLRGEYGGSSTIDALDLHSGTSGRINRNVLVVPSRKEIGRISSQPGMGPSEDRDRDKEGARGGKKIC